MLFVLGEIGGQLALAINLTAANPNLDAQKANFRQSLGLAVVNVSTESVQRSPTLLQHLLAGHLGSVQTSADLNLNALGASAHRVLDSHLDGASISHLALHLASDVLGYDVGVQIGLLHLEYVDLNVFLEEILELFPELVNVLAGLTDNDAGTGCANSNGDELQCAFDDYLGNAGVGQTLFQIFADFLVLHEVVPEILATEPI